MSTRSEIGILNNDGTITSIYCHWDGYPAHNGNILFNHYKAEEKVKKLIKNGDLSILGENVEPNKNFKHSFDEPQDDVCVYYHRDRNEKWEDNKPETYLFLIEWIKEISKGCKEYLYLFKNGKWHFSKIYYRNAKATNNLQELTKEFINKEVERIWSKK